MSEKNLSNVYLTGGDGEGWALDVDYRMTREALSGVVNFVTSPEKADVIHTVNIEQLMVDRKIRPFLRGRLVVAQIPNVPARLFEVYPSLYSECKNWICVAQSREAFEQLKDLKISAAHFLPYVAELKSFFLISSEDSRLQNLKKELKLPSSKYIIGSFVRDTLGADLSKFKPQKAADIFLGILMGVARHVGKDRIHVLLAGPRRHWLRKQLEVHQISYTFDGKIIEGDDYPSNILSLERLNLLTNLLDLYIIPSRWEGAPAGLFHTIACKKKIISSDMAVPRDILAPEAIFKDVLGGIDRVVNDMREHTLDAFVESNYARVFANHTPEKVKRHWGDFYASLSHAPLSYNSVSPADSRKWASSFKYDFLWKPLAKVSKLTRRLRRGKSITIWGELVDGPYGGGSQALKAIAAELKRRGFRVFNNSLNLSHGHILNSAFFDIDKLRSVVHASSQAASIVPMVPIVQRIDGPISIYRGKERAQDEAVFNVNAEFASATAFQSLYSWRESLNLGFDPKNPTIIRNACDPTLFFHKRTRKDFANRKIKIISTSWSTNSIKGFDVYEYLDKNLDFSRYDYCFVGRSPTQFKNIRMIDALPSQQLGEQLREADIYITASRHDPASNSLLEALACGLPSIYLKSGGHSEIASLGGIGFDAASEIPGLLIKTEENYSALQVCTYVRSIEEITDQYLIALGFL